jgi:hypothetical protein
MMCALAAASCISLAPSGFVVTDNVILKLSDVDRGEGGRCIGVLLISGLPCRC